jgi:hypothetical protein
MLKEQTHERITNELNSPYITVKAHFNEPS